MDIHTAAASQPTLKDLAEPLRLSTDDIPATERTGWLRDVICREYANVEVISPARQLLSQDLTIYPWDSLRLSIIRSSAIELERLPREPLQISQDAYFAVVLLSGHYVLEQDAKEVVLRPGDMTIYDATRPHRIHCPRDFTKLILSIPRSLLQTRMAGVERCIALPISGAEGIGAMASNFVRSSSRHAEQFAPHEFSALADHALDLLTLALASVRPTDFTLSRSRAASRRRIKALVEESLADCELDASMIARQAGLSARYINALFGDEGTSLMRYLWKRRLENCARDMRDPRHAGDQISDIAFRWGYSDAAHFSRAFKQQFGCAPREFRRVR